MTARRSPWLLLIHQIPPTPGYLRVKIWRRLGRLGAVAIKSSVYALPRSDQAYEDLSWVLREIEAGGGDGSICEAQFVDGLADGEVQALYRAARDVDYAELLAQVQAFASRSPPGDVDGATAVKLRRRLEEIVAIDFFAAPGRAAVETALSRLAPAERPPPGGDGPKLRGRTWVTRKGVFVDRMASAWLIRRRIDAAARFKFVAARGYRPARGELRFDMFDAEYTHDGDRCTFEVLLDRFGLDDAALRSIAEIVHDLDLKDSKFGRDDALGVERVLAGIARRHRADATRLERAGEVLDDLYDFFRGRR